MKVYMVEGYNLITGNQGVIDYIEAESEFEAYDKYEKKNPDCEANEIIEVYEQEEFEEFKKMYE